MAANAMRVVRSDLWIDAIFDERLKREPGVSLAVFPVRGNAAAAWDLLSGAHGIDADLDLPPPLEEDLQSFDPAATDSHRFEPLPRDLDQALDALLADDLLVDAFDGQLLSRLVDGRRAEADTYRGYVTDWERGRYLDEP